MNSDLTDLGQAQAAQQGRLMAPVMAAGPMDIFVSPLGRAQQTAQIALPGFRLRSDARLAEIDTGEWEGQLRADVCPDLAGLEAYCAAPGGEGFGGLHARVQEFLDELTGPSVLVAHGILGQVLRGIVRRLDRAQIAGLSNDQGCVYVLEDGTEQVLR